MTVAYRKKIECPRCLYWHPETSQLSEWIRQHPDLDSRDGYVISDLDFIVHRYKTPQFGREIQCMMFLEVKTHGADIEIWQKKTLSIERQCVKNQRGEAQRVVLDGPHGSKINVRHYGGFLLRLSNTTPDNSDWMTWHNRGRITPEQLVKILRFDVDPETLAPMDWRQNHHHPEYTIPLAL